MINERVREIKHAQREAFLLRELSSFYQRIVQDNPVLNGVYINNVVLSSDGSTCTVYFHSIQGKAHYEEIKETLILYKPSLRTSLAKVSSRRYVPQLIFRYAEGIEKQHRINDLIENLKKEGKL
jgi:ribosome-binding factor A